MPYWMSDAMIKLCRGPQWFSLSPLRFSLSAFSWFSLSRLWFSLSRSCGIAYDWTMALLICAAVLLLIGLAVALGAILLAVLIG